MAAEALETCEEIVRFVDVDGLAKIYQTVKQRLEARDQDQEVKTAAIRLMGCLLASEFFVSIVNVPETLTMLVEKLKNDTTRLPAARAFATAANGRQVDFSSVSEALVSELMSLLRKANRYIRYTAVEVIERPLIVSSWPFCIERILI